MLRFPHQRHLVDLPVAFVAADALRDMDAVIEENVIRHFIDASSSAAVCASAKLCRTGASISACVQICEWQVMQVSVGGIPALADISTEVWQ